MLSDLFRKLQRTPLLSDWIPYEDWLSPQAVLLSDGSACAAFEVDGVGFETADAEVINRWQARLNDLLRNIVSDRLVITVKLCRGTAEPSVLPRPEPAPVFVEALAQSYNDRLLDISLYATRIFLFLEWRPAQYAGEWIGDKITNRMPRDPDSIHDRLLSLERACALIQEQLADYRLRRLGAVQRGQAPFNEIAEAEALALTGVWRQVPITTGRIGDTLLCEDVTFHHEHIEIRGPGYTTYAAHLGMREYPAVTWPGLLNALLTAPFSFTLTQSYRMMERSEGESVLTRKQNKMLWAGDRATDQIAQLDAAANELASGAFCMGEHNLTLCVFAGSPDGALYTEPLTEVVNSAWRCLGASGCVVARENKGLMAAWLSMLAGNHKFRVRPGAISSRNFSALNPLFNFPPGPEESRWGKPIAITRSSGGTPYRFHWHDGVGDSAVANTLITGETGSGKTASTGFLIAKTAERILPKGGGIIMLDHKRGWHALTLAMGGSYMVLGDGTPAFAPLKALENTPRSIDFLTDLLRGCIRQGGWRDLTPEEDRRLSLGIQIVMQGPPENRSIGEVQAFLGTDEDGAASRLRKWCWGEELGWVIDAPVDLIDMRGDINTFDTTRLMQNLRARGPSVAYLFHRIELRLDGRPLLVPADELWNVLEIDDFEAQINRAVRTIRSKDGALVLISQSPRDAVKSRIAAGLVEQCPNQLHFPNPRASKADYIDGLHRTEGEVAALMSLHKGDGRFLLCKGSESSLQQIPLHGMDDELAVLSASEASLHALDQISEQDRRDPARFLTEYHRLRREGVRRKEMA